MDENLVKEFKEDVTTYTDINNMINEIKEKQLKPIQNKLKELQEKKKELEKDLCFTLEKSNSDLIKEGKKIVVESVDNKIVLEYQVKKSLIPISQKSIKTKMIDFYKKGPGSKISFNSFADEKKGIELYNYIYSKENRDYKNKDDIKIKPLNE